MPPNYYQNKLDLIEKLVAEKRFKKAAELVREELDLPYVPWKYEQFFQRWNDFLLRELKNSAPNKKASQISHEEFWNCLESHDAHKVALALQNAPNLNLHPIAAKVKGWISHSGSENRLAKIVLMDELARQKVGGQVIFENQTIDLSRFDSYFDNDFYDRVLQQIDQLTSQNPSLRKLAVQNFKNYLLVNFPSSAERPNLGRSIVRVTQKMLGTSTKLTTAEQIILEQIRQL